MTYLIRLNLEGSIRCLLGANWRKSDLRTISRDCVSVEICRENFTIRFQWWYREKRLNFVYDNENNERSVYRTDHVLPILRNYLIHTYGKEINEVNMTEIFVSLS